MGKGARGGVSGGTWDVGGGCGALGGGWLEGGRPGERRGGRDGGGGRGEPGPRGGSPGLLLVLLAGLDLVGGGEGRLEIKDCSEDRSKN